AVGGSAGGGGGSGGGSAPVSEIAVYLGYADTTRTPLGLSSPWARSPRVTFVGCGNTDIANPGVDNCPKNATGKDEYDGGAIRLVHNSGAAVTITDATVQIGGNCVYRTWPGLNATVQPGTTLILTQTGGKSPCGEV